MKGYLFFWCKDGHAVVFGGRGPSFSVWIVPGTWENA